MYSTLPEPALLSRMHAHVWDSMQSIDIARSVGTIPLEFALVNGVVYFRFFLQKLRGQYIPWDA